MQVPPSLSPYLGYQRPIDSCLRHQYIEFAIEYHNSYVRGHNCEQTDWVQDNLTIHTHGGRIVVGSCKAITTESTSAEQLPQHRRLAAT